MLELDLLLLPFFEQAFESLSADQQNTFIELLEQDDPDLLAWFSRKARPQADNLAAMVDLILDRVQPG